MKKNTNAFKSFLVLFIFILSAVSVSALSLITEFEDGSAEKSIMPGTTAKYYVMGVADQGLSKMQVTAQFYDITTGNRIYLGNIFNMSTIETFFYPDVFTISPSDFTNLPGDYVISVKAEEWLTNGIYRTKTSELSLEVIGNRQPIAQFDYLPLNPSTITPVTFDSTSYDEDGYIVKQEWFSNSVKIGEGDTFIYTFPMAGVYTVALKVTDNEGATASATKIITVTQGEQKIYPIADFTHSPSEPETNQQITFTSTSYDPDGTITKEEWDFNNDGIFETVGHAPIKSFSQAGSYKVTLRVTDNSNLQSSVSKVVVVKQTPIPNVPPVAGFTYSPSTNITVNQIVKFTSTSYDTDGYLVSQKWYINNVLAGSGNVLDRSFSAPGTYTVMLTVEDDDGAQDSETKQIVANIIIIPNVPPVADFTYTPDKNITVNDSISFRSTSYDNDGKIVKEEWDFNNDGMFEIPFEIIGYVVAKHFETPGNHTVSLRVTDDDGAQAIVSKVIVVSSKPVPLKNVPPVADFVYSPSANITVNQSVTFTSTSYDVDGSIVKEEWDLNNDGLFTWTGRSVVKAFASPGSYPVYLRVYDDDGANASVMKVVVVVKAPTPPPANKPPVANFTYTVKDGNIENITCNQTVIFTSNSYDSDGYLVSQNWYINSASAGSGANMTKIFQTAGMYNVTLTVKDDDGAQNSMTKQIKVSCEPVPLKNVPPVADFVYSPSVNITVNQSVTFTSTSYDVDGSIVKEEWDLNNDGLFTWTGRSVVKAFASPGSYPVYLRVYDDDGANASVMKVVVVVKAPTPPPANKPPVADFIYDPNTNITVNKEILFTSTSYDSDGSITKEEWDFNNNGAYESVGNSFSRAFTQTGNYVISLRVTDNDGAMATVSKTIVVADVPVTCPPDAILRMPESVTMNTPVKLDGSLSTAGCNGTIVQYKWQVYKKGALVSEFSTITPITTYNFTSNMQYSVILTVYNNFGLWDSDEKALFAGRAHQDIVVGSEDDLYVDYFDVIGSEYGVISCTETFVISATVSNDRDEDIEDLRVTFAIPELGYSIKSAAFDLDAGKTKTVTFYGDLDMMKEEVQPGEYYAFIGASDTDTIRVKHFPLMIE